MKAIPAVQLACSVVGASTRLGGQLRVRTGARAAERPAQVALASNPSVETPLLSASTTPLRATVAHSHDVRAAVPILNVGASY